MKNYIKVERFKDELISGPVSGIVKINDLVEVYDILNSNFIRRVQRAYLVFKSYIGTKTFEKN